MKNTIFTLTFVLAASLASGCIITSGEDSSLTIDNASSFVLVDIAVRDSGQVDYGDNLLRGSGPLFPDDQITVILDCDTYDVLVVDNTDFMTELFGLSLCFDDAVWVIDDAELGFARRAIDTDALKFEAAARSERVIDARN